jgi:hypothetical protein
MHKLQEKPSALKKEHSTLQNMKILTFTIFVGHFCPPRSGSWIQQLELMRIHADQDPQPWDFLHLAIDLNFVILCL